MTSPPDEKIYFHHLLILAAGFFVGIAAAYVFMSIPFDFSDKLEQARKLGVISRTILDGYPKQRDIYNYAAVLGFPILFGIGGWLMWVGGERYQKLNAMSAGHLGLQKNSIDWKIAGVTALFYLVISFICFRSPTYGNLAALSPWLFLVEEGENLAWAQSLLNGGIYGRDVHCLYGPMLIYPLVWSMKLFGASVATLRFYTFFLNLAAYGVIVTFLYKTFRNKATFIAAAAIYFWTFSPLAILTPNASYLRVTLGIFPLLLAYVYLGNPRRWVLVAAGAVLGQSVLFSQEVGLCSIIAVCAVFVVVRLPERRFQTFLQEAGLIFAGGAISVAPMLGYFSAKGVLAGILTNLLAHPRLLSLGFQTLPFPDIRVFFHAPFDDLALIFYCIIFVYILSALYLIPLLILRHRDRDILLRAALLVFGILLFRAALGRSDEPHAMFVLPPALLLTTLFFDDALAGIEKSPSVRRASKIAVVSLVFLFIVLVPIRKFPFQYLKVAFLEGAVFTQIPRMDVPVSPITSDNLSAIHHFLETSTKPGDYVYFFPNEAAFYFIFDRKIPTRYVHAMFAGTTAMRLELITELEQKQPAYVVYNQEPINIEGIAVDEYLPEVVNYLQSKYQRIGQHNEYVFLKRI